MTKVKTNMSGNSEWINKLPSDLQQEVMGLIQKEPASKQLFDKIYAYLASSLEDEDRKRKRSENSDSKSENATPSPGMVDVKTENGGINEQEIIFELPQISFQSPVRKKLSLIFHLTLGSNGQPEPLLLIALPVTYVPEFTIRDLSSLIRLCVLLPILGNSTTASKKNIGLLCFWIKDSAAENVTKNDPIICQINFDTAKKQLIKTGKIPAEAETKINALNVKNENSDGIKPISEAIISFLQRQFQLCGIHLINYLPSLIPTKNQFTLNTDSGLALSKNANSQNDLVIIEAYKGAKDGSLAFLASNEYNPPFIIFGFKKPILVFEVSSIKHISYSNITRLTFSLSITVSNEKKDSKVETIEFGMLDQKYFQIIDDFTKRLGINDDSFNAELKEKATTENGDNTAQKNDGTSPNQQPVVNDSDDEDEDGTYQAGMEQEEGSDVPEEYDSNAESEENEDNKDDENQDTFQKFEE